MSILGWVILIIGVLVMGGLGVWQLGALIAAEDAAHAEDGDDADDSNGGYNGMN